MFHEHHAQHRLRQRRATATAGYPLVDGACEQEARHHVGDDDHRVAVDLAHPLGAVRGVGDGDHRVGVGVIDEAPRQDGVQEGLDRGRRRPGAEGVDGQLLDHLGGAERRQPGQAPRRIQAHRGEARLLDGLEVPAAPLDVEDLLLHAEEIAPAQLDRRVAAAVQHQRAVAAQQSRGVDPQPELAAVPAGFGVIPKTLHSRSPAPRLGRLAPADRGGRRKSNAARRPRSGRRHRLAAGASSPWAPGRRWSV